MANKKNSNKNTNEALDIDGSEEMSQEDKDFVEENYKWTKKPQWSLFFKNREAIINGVTEEEYELLQKDDNKGFAKEVVAWVASNSGKVKIGRFIIRGSAHNIGTRGPGPEGPSNPFKMRPAKKGRGTSGKATGSGKAQELSTEAVVQFILSGKLDAAVFKAALDEVRQARLAQIQKLQAEIAGLSSWEQLAAAGNVIGGE